MCGSGICGFGICGMGICGIGICGMGTCGMGIRGFGICGMGMCGFGRRGLGRFGLGMSGLGTCGLGTCGCGMCGFGTFGPGLGIGIGAASGPCCEVVRDGSTVEGCSISEDDVVGAVTCVEGPFPEARGTATPGGSGTRPVEVELEIEDVMEFEPAVTWLLETSASVGLFSRVLEGELIDTVPLEEGLSDAEAVKKMANSRKGVCIFSKY